MSRNRLLLAAALMALTALPASLPQPALAACNPSQSPLGSIGCQPALGTPVGTDLVLGWRPSLFPNSTGVYTIANLATYFASATGFVTGPGSSTIGHIAVWNDVAGITLADGGALATIATSGLITDATGILLPAHGGTGAATLAAHGIVLGEGTAPTNVTPAMTSGQLLIGQGASSDPQPETVTGDISITLAGATTVGKINGVALGTTTATSANVLIADGSQWVSRAFSGDFTIGNTGVATLATVNANTGSFGDGTHVGAFTVNGKGLITAASSVAVTGAAPTGSAGGGLTGTYPNPTVAAVPAGAMPALTGDITTSAGAVATTLATVNSNVGSFGDGTHVSAVTVNAKGLVTAASSVAITGAAPSGSASGDLSGSYPGPTVAKANGVTYPASPSANTVPVVTSATSGGTVTYEAVPNAALANSSMTLAGHSVALGGTQAIACGDLSNGATGCSTATGTSGATTPLLNGTNVWSGQQSVSPTTLAISTATFTPDGTSNNYTLTMVHASCPCTLANPSATPVAGTGGQIVVKQSATGSDTFGTWGSQYESSGGTATLTLSTGANAVDILSYYVRDSTHIELSLLTNFSH